MSSSSISWDQFLSNADTGDVMLFVGDSLISRAIEALSGTFSHSGMVVVSPDGKKWLWQAAGEDVCGDPFTDMKKHKGAQLGPLGEATKVVSEMGDVPTYRRLRYKRPPDFNDRVWSFAESLDGRPFPSAEDLVLNYGFGNLSNVDNNPGEVFCSQLVAMTLQDLGVLSTEWVPNSYSPTDLSSMASTPIELLVGSYDDDQLITMPPQ